MRLQKQLPPQQRPARRRRPPPVASSPQPVKRAAWPLELTLTPRVRYVLPPLPGPPDEDCSLTAYMRLPVSHYSLLALPLGATLTRVAGAGETSSDAVFALTIPRVRLLSLTVQPTVVVAVAPTPDRVRLEAKAASVEGSLVERLGLNGADALAARLPASHAGAGQSASRSTAGPASPGSAPAAARARWWPPPTCASGWTRRRPSPPCRRACSAASATGRSTP